MEDIPLRGAAEMKSSHRLQHAFLEPFGRTSVYIAEMNLFND